MRHPMYTSFFISGFVQALLLANWIAGPAALVAVALRVFVRVPNEERMMIAPFGNDYRDSLRRTGGYRAAPVVRWVCALAMRTTLESVFAIGHQQPVASVGFRVR